MTGWTLAALSDQDAVKRRLAAAGLTPNAAHEKAKLFAQAAAELASHDANRSGSAFAWYVPGRIEVLGKHTDYAGGRSLTAAVERGCCAVAVARDGELVRIIDARDRQQVEFPFSPDLTPTAGHWSVYPMTVARRVARNFGAGDGLRPASIAFAGDLPLAAGLSSSSALVIAMFLLLADVNKLREHPSYRHNIRDRLALANYAATIENGQSFGELAGDRGVGTFGGSEDHVAILDSKGGMLGQYSYCPVSKERAVTLSDTLVFAIAASGIVAEKTGAAMDRYNRASRLGSAVADVWRGATGRDDAHLAAAIRSAPDAADRLRDLLRRCIHTAFSPDELLARFEHFVAESEQIVPGVAENLAAESLDQFGELVDRSQSLAEALLGNQVPETGFLARSARELGAIAASAFGAGYGGGVWALIEQDHAEQFLDTWGGRYRAAFPVAWQNAAFLTSKPGPSAFAL
jgi:galactokinase